jgi:hypothetical protein
MRPVLAGVLQLLALKAALELRSPAVQNFVSAAVGIAVAVALVRRFARSRTGELGDFWADMVHGPVGRTLGFIGEPRVNVLESTSC